MKTYDYKRTREIIEQYKEDLVDASLGMHEDWFWTATVVWEGGEYKHALPDNADEMEKAFRSARSNGMGGFLDEKDERGIAKFNPEYDDHTKHCVAGIYGSYWATPTLQLRFKDGSEKMIEVSKGETAPDAVNPLEYGCLSGPVQESITPITE
jgi:hypothetical protein